MRASASTGTTSRTSTATTRSRRRVCTEPCGSRRARRSTSASTATPTSASTGSGWSCSPHPPTVRAVCGWCPSPTEALAHPARRAAQIDLGRSVRHGGHRWHADQVAQPTDLLAVLIDADNVSPARIGAVLTEIAKYGTASVKRVYGDWTKPNLRGWKDAASEHVIQPMQQFDNTTGKNATDSALIIDAMDLLYTRRFQGFCIVSSDSDFTRLASRIREDGVTVYGFGERQTPESLRNACDRFTYLDVLVEAEVA